ncbi:hypothetical protein NKH77_45940 [Streptomyces sp. M19]
MPEEYRRMLDPAVRAPREWEPDRLRRLAMEESPAALDGEAVTSEEEWRARTRDRWSSRRRPARVFRAPTARDRDGSGGAGCWATAMDRRPTTRP